MMNVVYVVDLKYPGALKKQDVIFMQNCEGTEFWITKWDIPGVPQPTIEELEQEIPLYQRAYDVKNFEINATQEVDILIKTKPREKQYDNDLSIISYSNSKIDTWLNEAVTYSAWRDSVWEDVFNKFKQIEEGAAIPSIDEFIASLPPLVWPD